jgi:putative nucleotidyltransferase with HDIG domain
LGVLFSKRIASPIKKLVEGTRHIAKGDLKYFIEIAGNDEISDLTRSFNEMTANLYESRRKLHNYFYGVIQSFVRLVEARDPYTRGHSERVALYAEKIAAKLGLPQDKAQLVRETALLHDIGKFGVKESILNKKESLTEEEWETIRKHPVIGEEILKPILLNEEMQGIVREHHERFDGKGYPDRLKGDKINLLAQILSVADSYDAMTSSRAYRPAFTKEKAIEELKKASGSQFNPKVVDAFIEVLREEE